MTRLVNIRGIIILIILLGTVTSASANYSTLIPSNNSFPVLDSLELSVDSPLLTWTSRTQNESFPVNNNSMIIGDHIVLNATFPEELNVTRCEMRVWNGFTYTTTRPLVVPTNPGGVFTGIIDPAQFDWVVISGLEAGFTVNITCNFTASDCDFMAWPESIDESEYTYANNIVDMASGHKPEHDEIMWPENGTLTIGCLDYCGEEGNWTLHLQVGADLSVSGNESSITMDTYYLDKINQTYSVEATGYTDSNITYVIIRDDVRICNFFAPEVKVYSPVSLVNDERTYNISWSSTDRNADDVNYYSVWLSSNDGVSYMLFALNRTCTSLLWNSSGWLEDVYIFRIRAYSIDLTIPGMADLSNPPAGYWPGDFGDGFSASFPNYVPAIIKDVIIIGPEDIYYEFGAHGNAISWDFAFSGLGIRPEYFSYTIYKNSEVLKSGYIDYHHGPTGPVLVDVDNLQAGTYNYTLRCYNPGESGGYVHDVVYVIVNEPLFNTTSTKTATTNTTQIDHFVSNLLQISLVITIPVVALIGLIVVVNKGFDRDIIRRNNWLSKFTCVFF